MEGVVWRFMLRAVCFQEPLVKGQGADERHSTALGHSNPASSANRRQPRISNHGGAEEG